MSSELEQLRADLEVVRRYTCTPHFISGSVTVRDIEARIAKLEAKEADPWREAKDAIDLHLASGGHRVKDVARYAQHLEAENARLTGRVAELESRPVPPLDPARVKRTSLEVGYISGDKIMNAEPYPLAEVDSK